MVAHNFNPTWEAEAGPGQPGLHGSLSRQSYTVKRCLNHNQKQKKSPALHTATFNKTPLASFVC